MLHKHKIVVALGLLALLGAVEVAHARYSAFGGSRSQVRNACSGPGRHLTEGVDHLGAGWSSCTDLIRHTGVTCDDGGSCVGYSPRVGSVKKPPRKPRGNDYQVPKSLSEPVYGAATGMGEVGTDMPAPDPDIIN